MTHAIIDAPCTCAETDLQEGMAIEEHDYCYEEFELKGVVGACFVGFVERVGFGEFVLVVFEFLLLRGREDRVFS